jgi:formate-dependent nitrite reductase membrane component NrfD
MPRPSVSPVATVEPEEQAVDPILFVFAGVIALVVAGIVVMAVKNRKPKNRTNQKNK